jgi:hypothetical protein
MHFYFVCKLDLKGQCHEIFDLGFFHDVDTGGKFTASFVDTDSNLPAVTLIPVSSVVDTGVNLPRVTLLDTGGKFATGIKDTSGSDGKICHRCH